MVVIEMENGGVIELELCDLSIKGLLLGVLGVLFSITLTELSKSIE